MRPQAYSYIRFSTPDQIKGDSLRRQVAASEAYAEAHGLELDRELTFRDLGVSAFRGQNADEGALGQFVAAVDAGSVALGSYLLIENLDRLSRDRIMPALNQLQSLLEKGVRVVTLDNEKVYDAESLNNLSDLIVSLSTMARAHEESALKAKRVAEAWDRKREAAAKGKKLTAKCPAWLSLSADRRKFKVIEERAAVIRLIFEMKASGIGSEAIVRRLNAEPKLWKPAEHHANRRGGWRKGYVDKIIHTRAVIGEYQSHKMVNGKNEPAGDPIPDYFPAVVDKELFDRVQAILARNFSMPGRGGGANGAINNLFGHVARCARCGGPMSHINKGPRPKGGQYQYLQCDQARRGIGCDKATIRYDRLEPLLLHFCRGLDARDLLTDEAQKAREEARLRHQLQAIDGELAQIKTQVANLTTSLARQHSPALQQTVEEKLESVLTRRAKLEQDRQQIMLDTAQLGKTPEHIAEHIASVEDLIERMDELQGSERGELRRRLRQQLHGLLDRIDIEASASGAKLRMTFAEGAQVSLMLDAEGGLRLVRDDSGGTTLICSLDGHGNVLSVDKDLDEDEAGRQKRLDRQKEVDKMVARALRRRSINPSMIASRRSGRAPRPRRGPRQSKGRG